MFSNGIKKVIHLIVVLVITHRTTAGSVHRFPDDFMFGVSTASYQIEGAWNKDGKGENIWDHLTHTRPSLVADGGNAEIACDSYRLYERDIEMISDLGVDFYRFSISWTRVLPTGSTDEINKEGLDYYNKLIDGLLAKNVTPIVTMYHWDLPQNLQNLGGWPNPVIADYFQVYADFLFKTYGDRVKHWVTINEPYHICFGYSTYDNAPAINATGVGDYLCSHTILKAHAQAYHLYKNTYKLSQKGVVGIVLDIGWFEPETNSTLDVESVERTRQFLVGWYAHPIFSKTGDYPPIMRKLVDKKSFSQGFKMSRLPKFSKEEIKYIRGSSDFFGLNHYTSWISYGSRQGPSYPIPSHNDDFSRAYYQSDKWKTGSASWCRNTPWGFRKILNWIKDEYNNPTLLVTENGFASNSGIDDDDRVDYMQGYLKALLAAKNEDGCNVIGYGHWSLMDNFEWMDGYRVKFGLYDVDFSSPNRTRTMRKSGYYYNNIIKNRVL